MQAPQYIPGPRTRAALGALGQSVLDTLLNVGANAAETYVANNVKVTLKTNLTPEITLYDPTTQGDSSLQPGLLGQLGIQASVLIYDTSGNLITTLPQGQPVPVTDPVKVIIGVGLVGALAYLLVRGVGTHL
jgi:hypothetical protein